MLLPKQDAASADAPSPSRPPPASSAVRAWWPFVGDKVQVDSRVGFINGGYINDRGEEFVGVRFVNGQMEYVPKERVKRSMWDHLGRRILWEQEAVWADTERESALVELVSVQESESVREAAPPDAESVSQLAELESVWGATSADFESDSTLAALAEADALAKSAAEVQAELMEALADLDAVLHSPDAEAGADGSAGHEDSEETELVENSSPIPTSPPKLSPLQSPPSDDALQLEKLEWPPPTSTRSQPSPTYAPDSADADVFAAISRQPSSPTEMPVPTHMPSPTLTSAPTRQLPSSPIEMPLPSEEYVDPRWRSASAAAARSASRRKRAPSSDAAGRSKSPRGLDRAPADKAKSVSEVGSTELSAELELPPYIVKSWSEASAPRHRLQAAVKAVEGRLEQLPQPPEAAEAAEAPEALAGCSAAGELSDTSPGWMCEWLSPTSPPCAM